MRLLLPVAVAVATTLLAGCQDLNTGGTASSSSSGGTTTTADGGTTSLRALDVQGYCARLANECGSGIDQTTCVRSYLPVRVTSACASLVTTASCADLLSSGSTVGQTCFPTCASATLATCNGNGTVTVCTEAGVQNVDDCSASCTAQGTEWTGICASSYNGQTADRDQCWCK